MGEHVIAILDVGLQQQIDQFFTNYTSSTTSAFKRKIFYDGTANQIVIALETNQSESGKSQNFTDIKVSNSATTFIARFFRNVELPKPSSSSSLSSLPTVFRYINSILTIPTDFSIKRENVFNAKYSLDEKVIAIQYTQTLVVSLSFYLCDTSFTK